jgi:hypothetical protein
MMKGTIIILMLLTFLYSCKDEHTENTEALILKMSFDFGDVSFEENQGTIHAPENTNLKKLIPTIQISEGAVVYPPSKTITDFSEPVDYTVTSEDQKQINYYTVSVLLPIVKFIVFDCTNRSSENPTPQIASGVTISVFSDVSGEKQLIDELITDSKGEAFLYGYRNLEYYFLADKEGATNILDGYVVYGVFESQEEIDDYPGQNPPPLVGDLKFMDINADGRVNEDDKTTYQVIRHLPENEIKEIKVYIAKE